MSFIRHSAPTVYLDGTQLPVKDVSLSWSDASYTNAAYPMSIGSDWTGTMTTASTTQSITIDISSFQNSMTQVASAAAKLGAQIRPANQQMLNGMTTPLSAVLGEAPDNFNKYVNGSDLLEEFILFLGTEGVRQGDLMNLPIELFIKWLIIRACEEDQVEPDVVLALPAPTPQPRCLGCQRFMPKVVQLPLHDGQCADWYFARKQAA